VPEADLNTNSFAPEKLASCAAVGFGFGFEPCAAVRVALCFSFLLSVAEFSSLRSSPCANLLLLRANPTDGETSFRSREAGISSTR
jgi:hypothetical protein